MRTMNPIRLLGAATALSLSALAAVAQTTPPAPPAEKPPIAKPEAAPGAQNMPGPSTEVPKTAPKTAATPAQPLVGLSAFSSDGNKAGDVRAVKTAPDGKITAILVKVGGFLGFGGKIVEVPESKFTQRGENVQLGYTSDELSKLPEVKDAS
jgi:PRC-barrel domain